MGPQNWGSFIFESRKNTLNLQGLEDRGGGFRVSGFGVGEFSVCG